MEPPAHLFGSDARTTATPPSSIPAVDAAKIRAFFIHPDFARRGLGTLLLERCEHDAVAHGFSRFELMATLPGVRLYAARGYQAGARIEWPLGDGITIPFVPMSKQAAPPRFRIGRAHSMMRQRSSSCRSSPTNPRRGCTTT